MTGFTDVLKTSFSKHNFKISGHNVNCQMSGNPTKTARTTKQSLNSMRRKTTTKVWLQHSQFLLEDNSRNGLCVLALNSTHFILANTQCKQASVYKNPGQHMISGFAHLILHSPCADLQNTHHSSIKQLETKGILHM